MNRNGERANGRTGEEGCGVFSPFRRFAVSPILLLLLVGCSGQTGPDSNTAVFKTPEQASAVRKQKLLVDWQEMASKIANAERPDVKTMKGPGFSLDLSADGLSKNVNLTPLSEKLNSAQGKEREPIRAYLAEQFPAFDRDRLKKLGFERVRPMLYPSLVNLKQTNALAGAGHAPITNAVVLDLNWIPVARWGAAPTGAGSAATTPIDAEIATAWGVTAKQVNDAAMSNLRDAFTHLGQSSFDTIDLPGLGHYGSLRSEIDPTIVLLPEFLTSVRQAWKTGGDLVISFPSRTTLNFLERKNERLLNRMIPEWQKMYPKAAEPMIGTLLLDGDAGLSLLNYSPPPTATKPATVPVTKPKGAYIVR